MYAPRPFLYQAVNRRTHTRRVSVASVVLRVGVGGGLPAAMEHGELGDRVEGLATRPVNEDPLVRDRRHHIVLDEVTNETAGSHLVEVRRRDPGRIPVLGNEFGFESFVVVCRIVEDIRSVMEAHALDALRARLAPLRARTTITGGQLARPFAPCSSWARTPNPYLSCC